MANHPGGMFKVLVSRRTDQAYWTVALTLTVTLLCLIVLVIIWMTRALNQAFRQPEGVRNENASFQIQEAKNLDRLKLAPPVGQIPSPSPTVSPTGSPLPSNLR